MKLINQNSNRHKRIELWAKSIKSFGNFGRHFPRATSAKILAVCTRVKKIVPYHRESPHTRNGARLWSPSPIMAPANKQFSANMKMLNCHEACIGEILAIIVHQIFSLACEWSKHVT